MHVEKLWCLTSEVFDDAMNITGDGSKCITCFDDANHSEVLLRMARDRILDKNVMEQDFL